MWKRFLSFFSHTQKQAESCARLHGKRGKVVPFPKDIRELDSTFGPVMRELAKR